MVDYVKLPWKPEYRTWNVQRAAREPLVRFIAEGLQGAGCRIIFASEPSTAPFRLTFETPEGERMGVIAYAFFANSEKTKNRPDDEWRFQVKYGSNTDELHELWQDPLGLYTTLMIGIAPDAGLFVSADPVLNSPTRFFKSIEFKDEHVENILHDKWHAWERPMRPRTVQPEEADQIEVLVGGTADQLLRLIRFEREALGEDQGHRQWLADQSPERFGLLTTSTAAPGSIVTSARVHQLAREFELPESAVFDLIASTPRLKMAVRGWVAEEHLRMALTDIEGVTDCHRMTGDRESDVSLRFKGSKPVTVECKNVLRTTLSDGRPRVDFQRSRASKSDPCSRYYSDRDFDVVAACLHAITDRWEFRFHSSKTLAPHERCEGKLDHKVRVGDDWVEDIARCLAEVTSAA